MRLRCFIVCCGVALSVVSSQALAENSEKQAARSLNRVLLAYHCALYNRLRDIHRHPPQDKDRFLVMEVDGGDQRARYVQVWLVDDDRQADYEASSGFFDAVKGRKRLFWPSATSRVMALMDFGPASGADGNYRQRFSLESPAALWGLAGSMLETLQRGYDARVGAIRIIAPYAGAKKPRRLPSGEACRAGEPSP